MSTVINEGLPQPRALICWPVEFLDTVVRKIHQPHVTALYFPDVVDVEFTKQDMLDTIRTVPQHSRYQLVNVSGAEAFGPDNNVPVLRVNSLEYFGLESHMGRFRNVLDSKGMRANRTYGFNPHVTVDLPTLIKPPTQVLLRPLELWWMDDEPVVI